MELVKEMVPGLVTPSCRAVRASFEAADISEDLGEDMGCELAFRASASAGYNRGTLVMITSGSAIATRAGSWELTWLARDCASTSTPNRLVSPRSAAA